MRWKFGAPLTLETEKYVLRSIVPGHIPGEMVSWFSDRETMKYMNDPMDLDNTQLSKFFSRYNNSTRIALLIYDRQNNKPIGIFRIYLEPKNELAYTSIMIGDKEYWGANVVIEVRERIVLFLFSALRMNKICGNVRSRNLPALFNYSRQHFQKEGIRKQQIRNHEGNLEDVVEFALFKEDWIMQKRAERALSDAQEKV